MRGIKYFYGEFKMSLSNIIVTVENIFNSLFGGIKMSGGFYRKDYYIVEVQDSFGIKVEKVANTYMVRRNELYTLFITAVKNIETLQINLSANNSCIYNDIQEGKSIEQIILSDSIKLSLSFDSIDYTEELIFEHFSE